MPHKTKIVHKPEGVGAEMKSLCCGVTGILLKLDIMEGKDHQATKPYHSEYGEGTVVTLRLTEEYFGSARVVHADSAFCKDTRGSKVTWSAIYGNGQDSFKGVSQLLTC